MLGNRAPLPPPSSPGSRHVWRGRRRPGLARLLALGVAVAWFSAQLASLSHLASHPHIVCQEHGELEDAPGTAHVGEIPHDQASYRHGAAPDSQKGHEHCLFGTHARHGQATDSVQAQGVPARLVSHAASAKPPIHRAPLFTVYRLAPKTSPPA
jgi:hypothetical protein